MDQTWLAGLGLWLETARDLVVAAVWIPLAADLTPAHTADNDAAPALIQELAKE